MESKKTRFNPVDLKRIFKGGAEGHEPVQPHHLQHKPSPYEEYSFENGRVMLNGMDVASLIDSEGIDVELMACLAGAIEEYRHIVWDRYGTKFKSFNGQVQGILEKILNKMNRAYEELSGGIRVHLQGGRLWVNDIDAKVVLTLFLSNPTEERRRYLQSIQTKLGLILEGKAGKSFSHAVLEEAKKLFVQIRKAFENTPAAGLAGLLAAMPHLDR